VNALNSLGLAKAPRDTRVVVAMSGGVDSSVAAAMLAAEGYDVVGLTMQLYDHGAATSKSKACCAGQDIYDARRVADRIGFPHYVLDYEGTFQRDVIDRFADAYVNGETPVPCVLCNQTVKFRDLLKAAQDLGADVLATGHYIRRTVGVDGPELRRATDPERDQSYFLFATTRAQLDMLRFPLGDLPKAETRRLAQTFNLAVADKPDSQDICFVPQGNYADIVAKLRPQAVAPGDIVHLDGRVLGRHAGIIHFTVGQRRGLGIGGEAEPLYVIRIDPDTAQVIVGPKEALMQRAFSVHSLNWLGADGGPGEEGLAVTVKLRNTQPPVAAHVFSDTVPGKARVVLAAPEGAVSPGQACVMYDGDRMLGGGWIERSASQLPHNLRRMAAAG
jgi:tRNA-specific 2-thiouridylase